MNNPNSKLVNFAILAHYYISNRRLDDYGELLRHGLNEGYKFCSVFESLDYLKIKEENLFCLRHDVDEISPGTMQLAKIEHELGIKSTFYFRIKTAGDEIIENIKSLRHEVSYHFETIAEYARDNNITSREQFNGQDYLSDCIGRLKKSLGTFRDRFNVPCRTLAAHGAPENAMLGISNAQLFKDAPELSKILDIDIECYEEKYLAEWDAYVSDCPIETNWGYRYGMNPQVYINQGVKRIMFLSHPNHWGFSLPQRLKRLVRISLHGQDFKQDEFACKSVLRGFTN